MRVLPNAAADSYGWIIHWYQKFMYFQNVLFLKIIHFWNTHTHTVERVSIKISDNLLLVESPILPIPPFLWKKSERLLFLKYFENSNLSLYKWEVPTMVICTGLSDRIKLSKSKRCIGSFLRYFCSNCRYWLLRSY